MPGTLESVATSLREQTSQQIDRPGADQRMDAHVFGDGIEPVGDLRPAHLGQGQGGVAAIASAGRSRWENSG